MHIIIYININTYLLEKINEKTESNLKVNRNIIPKIKKESVNSNLVL